MPGSWTFQSYLTPYDSFIFYNATGKHEDYFYQPLAVAKQVVNGTNYRFAAIAEPLKENLSSHFAIIDMHQPIGGEAYTTNITFV
ncbi:hypothetical protein [Clostridium transplantifaecale]|uniref:hypothetical protein n=1 Tax=Clostridium transplantifaecale TaxID=2479838 RepID=UPI000F62E275|nr:hypothetical protein [Clostridium transplantifaecale]